MGSIFDNRLKMELKFKGGGRCAGKLVVQVLDVQMFFLCILYGKGSPAFWGGEIADAIFTAIDHGPVACIKAAPVIKRRSIFFF